jgi:hypothetical protein
MEKLSTARPLGLRGVERLGLHQHEAGRSRSARSRPTIDDTKASSPRLPFAVRDA